MTDNTTSNVPNCQAYSFTPGGREGEIDVCDKSCTVDVVNGFSAERNEDDADIVEALHKQAKITEIVEDSFVSTTKSLTCDTAEGVYKIS